MREYTKERVAFTFGEPMIPCPKCGSFHIQYQTPIKSDITGDESIKQMLGKFARATKAGATPLQGPCYIMCWGCGHKSPAVDCSGRTSESVGRDRVVAKKMRDLWNAQPKESA